MNNLKGQISIFLSCIKFYIFFLLLKRSFRFLLYFLFSRYLFFFDELFILDFYNCELFSPIPHFHFNERGNSVGDSGESSLPTLPSSSSSESLNTFRNVIAAENEAEIYTRIRDLENMQYFNLPPQNNPGDYERLVREHFNQAINVDHFRLIFDLEYFDIKVLERKGLLQDSLFNLMISEQNLPRIMSLSPYTDIRKEAYEFLEDKVRPVNSLEHSFQRHIMDGSLHFFIQDINRGGRNSEIYREFYKHFTDEDFRRQNGLPLP